MLVAKLSRQQKIIVPINLENGYCPTCVKNQFARIALSPNGRRDLKMLIWELLLERKYAQNELKKLASLSEAISAQKRSAIKFISQAFSLNPPRIFLIAFVLQWNCLWADTIVVPATVVYRGNVGVNDCSGSHQLNYAFPTIEQAIQATDNKVVCAINCSMGQVWRYDFVRAEVAPSGSTFAIYGRCQYNGSIGQIRGGVVQHDCLPQTNIGGTTCTLVSPGDQLNINGVSQKPKLDICPNCGNPIVLATGNKFQTETDYRPSAISPLSFIRYYNSVRVAGASYPSYVWRNGYQRRILTATASDGKTVYSVERPNSDHRQFVVVNGVTQPRDAEVIDKLELQYDASSVLSGFRFTNSVDDSVELYDSTGKLLSITARNGLTQTLTYSDGTANGAAGALIFYAQGQTPSRPLFALPAGVLLYFHYQFCNRLTFCFAHSQPTVSFSE